MRYSETGQLMNGSLADYLVPMAVEMPDIEIGACRDADARHRTRRQRGRRGRHGGRVGLRAQRRQRRDGAVSARRSIAQLPMTPARILKALDNP